MKKKQDWEIQASTAVNVTGGDFRATLKLKGKPFTNINQARRARDDIVLALRLVDYVKAHAYRGLTQHEIQNILRGDLDE